MLYSFYQESWVIFGALVCTNLIKFKEFEHKLLQKQESSPSMYGNGTPQSGNFVYLE